MILKTKLLTQKGKNASKIFSNEYNASNFKDLALFLRDMKSFNLPIDKAIKELSLEKSDWDASLGF